MTARPAFDAMGLPELVAWEAALRLAIAALENGGEDAALYAVEEGISVTVTIRFAIPAPDLAEGRE